MIKWFHGEEESQEVPRYKRGEGGVTSRAGDTSAGQAGGKQEARRQTEAQSQPGQDALRSGPRLSVAGFLLFPPSIYLREIGRSISRSRDQCLRVFRQIAGPRRGNCAFFCAGAGGGGEKYIVYRFVKEFNSSLMIP
jgi:hypothetical protein